MDTKELSATIVKNFNGYSLDTEAVKLAAGDLDAATKKAIAQHVNAIRDGRISRPVTDWAASEQGRKYDGYLGIVHPCVLDGFIRAVILKKN